MKKKAFTLVEVVVAIVIMGIMITVAYPVYKNAVEDSAAKVCAINELTAGKALIHYISENKSVPAALSQLPNSYIEKAYAEVFKEKGNFALKLAYFITELNEDHYAYAGILGISGNNLKCPNATGAISYGINTEVANLTGEDAIAEGLDKISYLIADTSTDTFDEATPDTIVKRHKTIKLGTLQTESYAQGVPYTTDAPTIITIPQNPPPANEGEFPATSGRPLRSVCKRVCEKVYYNTATDKNRRSRCENVCKNKHPNKDWDVRNSTSVRTAVKTYVNNVKDNCRNENAPYYITSGKWGWRENWCKSCCD